MYFLGKKIIIEPLDIKQLNPNSYNLRLSDELVIYKEKILDMKKANQFKKIKIPNDGIVIYPGKLYLGRTVEFTETYDLGS